MTDYDYDYDYAYFSFFFFIHSLSTELSLSHQHYGPIWLGRAVAVNGRILLSSATRVVIFKMKITQYGQKNKEKEEKSQQWFK